MAEGPDHDMAVLLVAECPACHAPALPSGESFVFPSTSGPVIHQMWRCAGGCWWFSFLPCPDPFGG